MFFFLKYCDFSELCQFCCSAGVLPAWCVCKHTYTEGKQRKARVRNILISSEKNTIFNEHPVVYFSNNSATKPYMSKKRSAKRPFFMTIITPYSHTSFLSIPKNLFIHKMTNDPLPHHSFQIHESSFPRKKFLCHMCTCFSANLVPLIGQFCNSSS